MTKGASSAAQNSTGFGKDWLAPAPAKLTASRIAGFVAQSPVDRSSSRENATISIVAADCPVGCARGAHTDGLPGSGQKIPAAALCRRGLPGPLYAHSAECAGAESHRARLHLLWASRHRENGWRGATIAIEGLRDDSSRCLIGWYREGADVEARLPLLSTYLGHVAPSTLRCGTLRQSPGSRTRSVRLYLRGRSA